MLKNAVNGLKWSIITVLIIKISTGLTQFFLGWFLDPSDFATYAKVGAVIAVLIPIADGGGAKYLIQNGFNDHKSQSVIFTLTCFFTVLISLSLVGIGFASDRLVDKLLYFMSAILLAISTIASLLRAKINESCDFKKLAVINSASVGIKSVGTVLSAALNFGPLSFYVGSITSKIYELITTKNNINYYSLSSYQTILSDRNLLKSLFWISFASIGTSVSMNSDYIAVNLAGREDILGFYYFGFQLQVAFSAFITSSIGTVLLPVYSKISRDVVRIEFVQMIKKSIYYLFPIFIAIVLASPYLIDLFWKGKWNSSILVVQGLFISLGFRILTPMCRVVAESNGEWMFQSLLLWIDGILNFIIAFISSKYFGLVGLTYAICSYRFFYGFTIVLYTLKKENIPISTLFSISAKFGIFLVFPILTAYFLTDFINAAITFIIVFSLQIAFVPFVRNEYIEIIRKIKVKIIKQRIG